MFKGKILIIAHNTRSAGTLNYTKNILNAIQSYSNFNVTVPQELNISKPNIHVYKSYNSIFSKLFFSFLNIFKTYYLILKIRPKKIIVLGNYFFNLFPNIPTKVLIRHPHLLDSKNTKELSSIRKLEEFIRFIYFQITLKTNNNIILQNERFIPVLRNKYKYDGKINIEANAISFQSLKPSKRLIDRDNIFIYPSRYYEHKNHEFIIRYVVNNFDYLKNLSVKIILTIDKGVIKSYIKNKEIGEVIDFIGEVDQTDLFEIYNRCKGILFTSKDETFGNGLIEAIFFNLPIIVPKLPYATSLLMDYGVYYNLDDEISFNNAITRICNMNEKAENNLYKNALSHRKRFKNFNEWLEAICN